jgi:hypothetical protein
MKLNVCFKLICYSSYIIFLKIIEGIFNEPFSSFITMLKDDEWKNVRSIISATFTSGKLKSVSSLKLMCIYI